MPDLTKLTNKALQLNALRDICSYAVTSFKTLAKQKSSLKALLRDINPSRNRGMTLGIQYEAIHDEDFHSTPTNNYTSSNVSFQDNQGSNFAYSQGQSIAEQTLQRYGPDNNNSTQNQFNIKINTREHPVTGLQHPFDSEKTYLSR